NLTVCFLVSAAAMPAQGSSTLAFRTNCTPCNIQFDEGDPIVGSVAKAERSCKVELVNVEDGNVTSVIRQSQDVVMSKTLPWERAEFTDQVRLMLEKECYRFEYLWSANFYVTDSRDASALRDADTVELTL